MHLIKLCAGDASVADLEDWIEEQVAEQVKLKRPPRSRHVTHMVPKRAKEIVAGDSLYWVVKGSLAARQRIEEIEPLAVPTASAVPGCG